jgi:hypothetical protein
MRKKILSALVAILIIIQFLQPSKNIAEGVSENDITHVYELPEGVLNTFKNKCYDCHSQNTAYPWYYSVQPIGWWMDFHIKEGKDELNFSEFKTYPPKRANHKLEEITEAVNEGWMPLKSYQWMHRDSEVTGEEASAITAWVKSLGVLDEKN